MTLDFTEGTATHVQIKVIDLELAIQLAEHACDALNARIDKLTDELERSDLMTTEKYDIKARIAELRKKVEQTEADTELLEIQQLFYKKQLATGTIEINEGLDY